jgi:hypothetical protein
MRHICELYRLTVATPLLVVVVFVSEVVAVGKIAIDVYMYLM